MSPLHSSRFKRLVKTPKAYWSDSGMAAHLAAASAWSELERRNLAGPLVETWVQAELRKLLALERRHIDVAFWRTHDGHEVDFVLERGGELVGIEVKSGAAVRARDTEGLRRCRDAFGKSWRLGLVLHMGEEAVALDEATVAMPMGAFFRGP